jgi:stage V sporulation protein AA
MNGENLWIYLKAERNTVVEHAKVTVGDVVTVVCANEEVRHTIQQMELYSFHSPEAVKSDRQREQNVKVCSILKVVAMIQNRYQAAHVENMGEIDFVIQYKPLKPERVWLSYVKTAVTCVIIFFGSAFSIMTFNNDVSITKMFEKMYEDTMGVPPGAVNIIEVTYSLGLAVGILIYFNHIGRKKITPDPTPVQVQMRMYEKNVDETFMEQSQRGGTSLDVNG